MESNYWLGLVIGACWGVCAGVIVVAPAMRDARVRREAEVRRAVGEAIDARIRVYGPVVGAPAAEG